MDKLDRFQQLHRIFKSHRQPVPVEILADRLECTERTVKRLIYSMRDLFHAPIEYFPSNNGWQYTGELSEQFELPGLWLTSAELHSLVLLLHVLEGFGNGLLNEELDVVKKQIALLLAARGICPGAFVERIKVLSMSTRHVSDKIFKRAGEALLSQQQIQIRYKNYEQMTSNRTISPQTLIYYRENWYLDAWCHLRNDLRTFSLARIEQIEILEQPATCISREMLQAYFSESYGIFAGETRYRVRLRFLPKVAHEIARQSWHPEQEGKWLEQDYLLSFPCCDERELVGDILRYIPHVLVEEPASLRQAVLDRLQSGVQLFEGVLR